MFGGNDNTMPTGSSQPGETDAAAHSDAPMYDANGYLTSTPAPAASSSDMPSSDTMASASTDNPDSTLSSTPAMSDNNDTASAAPASHRSDADTDGLLDLKQQALQQLSPLVSHLDQTPEEKFRTTMMMIQASDDSSLLKDAYAAAQSITDEKLKAQALLDVINEINYFTQSAKQTSEQ